MPHLPILSFSRRAVFFALASAALLTSRLGAQDIQQSYTIPLETIAYLDEATGSTYYKYGINIGIGGGEAQTFEFDTGGEGFYAADVKDGWWGSDVTQTSDTFSKTFGSQINYSGTVAIATGIAFYAAPGATTPVLNLGTTSYAVGQAHDISQDGTTLWSGTSRATSPPPVQNAFYGDFGLTMKKGDHGVENVFAQLTYGNGITGGYVVSTGTYGSPNGTGYVRVGLTNADLTNPNTVWFQMSGSTGQQFAGSGFFTYGAELLTAAVTLTSMDGSSHTFAIGVNLDSGNPTPGIDYNSSDGSELLPFTTDGRLSDGVVLTIDGLSVSTETADLVYQLIAGGLYGQDYVYESERTDGGVTYLNIGTKIFQQYQVTYDLQDGLLGLTPYTVPEPSPALLGGLGVLTLVGIRRLRRREVAGN